MPLPLIRLLSQIDTNAPNGATVSAAELDDYIKQQWGFLEAFLSVGHNDDGTLKMESELLGADGLIPADMIGAGIKGEQIETESISNVHLVKKDAATGIGGAVTSAAIDNDQILAEHLATAAVETGAIKDLAVTGAKIADATITASKITGVLNAVNIPVSAGGVGANSLEASMLKTNVAYTGADVRVPVVTNAVGTNKFAKVGGVLAATLVGDVLTFVFSAISGEGSRDFGLAVQTRPPTDVMTKNVPQTRSGWEWKGGTFLSIVSDGGTNNVIRIKEAGAYIVFLFASVWGANAVAPGTNTARISSQLFRDTELLFTTTTKRTGVVANDEHWHFGAGLLIVGADDEDFEVFTNVEFVDGVWQQAFNAGDRAATMIILPVASET